MQTISPLLAVALVIAGIAAAAYSFWRYDFHAEDQDALHKVSLPLWAGVILILAGATSLALKPLGGTARAQPMPGMSDMANLPGIPGMK